jgi:hypothetical protein
LSGLVGGQGSEGKFVRERVASLLPFRVLEATGISRSFEVHTIKEMQAFSAIAGFSGTSVGLFLGK